MLVSGDNDSQMTPLKMILKAVLVCYAMLYPRDLFAQAMSLTDDLKQTQVAVASFRGLLRDHPSWRNDSYVRAGLAIADRFISRLQNPANQDAYWSRLQMREVGEIMDDLKRRIANPNAQPAQIDAMCHSRPIAKNGLLYDGDRPVFPGGYGHFDQVVNDLSLFPSLGVSAIQDARFGPSSMTADGSVASAADKADAALDRAARYGIHVDFLLSPHYYPQWSLAAHPDVAIKNWGHIQYNIDHPEARRVIGEWTEKITAAIKDKPALMSICLSNEPAYFWSGSEPYSAPAYHADLLRKHGTLANINALYESHYTSVDQIKPGTPPKPDEIGKRRLDYDWISFNADHFAAWHAWLAGIVHRAAPGIPTHSKIMYLLWDRDHCGLGVDPERMCNVTDWAGCDAPIYFSADGNKPWDEVAEEMWYDLLHSFKNQPVFNSENHFIIDNTTTPIPEDVPRTVLWQGALHHCVANTIWVWEQASSPSLVGSIYYRPADIFGVSRGLLDLARLNREVAAINQAPPDVAIVYSWTSLIWQSGEFWPAMRSAYEAALYDGCDPTFVSETQLADGHLPAVQTIIVSHAMYLPDAAVNGLADFAHHGGKIIFLGDDNLRYDEYHRPRDLPKELADLHPIPLDKDADSLADRLRPLIASPDAIVDAATAKPVAGLEYRITPFNGASLVSLLNTHRPAVTVRLPDRFTGGFDILNQEPIDPKSVRLDPMIPRLIKTIDK